MDAIAGRLSISYADRERLDAAVDDGAVDVGMEARAARAAVYRLGRQSFEDRLLRAEAEADTMRDDLHALAETWVPPKVPVGGKDVARLGLAAGPVIGAVLEAFEDQWVADDFPETGHQDRLTALVAALKEPRG